MLSNNIFIMNNLAELNTVKLDDRPTLQKFWDEQMSLLGNKSMEWREYVGLEVFNDYYKSLLQNIINTIDLPYKNIVIQYYSNHSSEKWKLNIAHKDADRLSCITICISDIYEPVCFYKDSDMPDIRGSQQIAKPVQTSLYSKNHPMLINVNNVHRVRVVEDQSPRILLQVSYDQSFDEIVNKNREIWNRL